MHSLAVAPLTMHLDFPELHGITRGIRNSRNVYEGYQRGFGLQFGDLRKQVLRDPLYREALKLAKGRTILAEDNRMNLFLILRHYLGSIEPGDLLEFGCYKGGNAIFMAHVARQLYPGMRVYALDTFEGMPDVDKGVDAHNKSDFRDVDLRELQSYARRIGLTNLEFVPGCFEDTAETVLKRSRKIALAHIDCDIGSSVRYSYQVVKDRMAEGGYIVFDDANVSSCIGATEAVEDLLIRRDGLNSEQIYPHFVFRAFRRPG